MNMPHLFLSRPGIHLPGEKLTNTDIIAQVRNEYEGNENDWFLIEELIKEVFLKCGSEERFIENDPNVGVGDIGALACRSCIEKNDLDPQNIDLLVHGAVAREYFEPATAMEIAAKIGIKKVHAFDVTSACVGLLESVHVAAGLFALHPEMRNAMVVSGELTRQFLSRKFSGIADFRTKAAGLTIGNASAAWALGKTPFPGGSLRIRLMNNVSLPEHWGLCQAPINGTFDSFSTEIFKLNVCVPQILKDALSQIGLSPGDVDHYIFHQPSNLMVDKVLVDLGVDPKLGFKAHGKFGNTVSTSVALCMSELLEKQGIGDGETVVLSSAAAGFTVSTLIGTWEK